MRVSPFPVSLLTALFVAVTAVPVAAQLERKPNLQPLPPSNLSVATRYPSGVSLRFASTTWNNGSGPLELRAGEVSTDGQNVYQRVFLDNGGYYDRLAGTFLFHPEHGHFHFENFARYSLEPIDVSTTPPPSSKITFCVMDTTKIDASLPGAPRKAFYSVCGDQIQGMSVGWGDTYGSTLPGQEIDVRAGRRRQYERGADLPRPRRAHRLGARRGGPRRERGDRLAGSRHDPGR